MLTPAKRNEARANRVNERQVREAEAKIDAALVEADKDEKLTVDLKDFDEAVIALMKERYGMHWNVIRRGQKLTFWAPIATADEYINR